MIYLRAADQPIPATKPSAGAPGARFAADLDLRVTRIGTLAVQRQNGSWAYVSDAERELIADLAIGPGSSAGELAGRRDCDPAAMEDYLVRLWQRGLLSADGGWAVDPDERSATISRQSRSVFSLILVLSSGCNLGCRYCYLGQEDPATWVKMPLASALRAVEWTLSHEAATTVVDLGEITVAGALWRELVEEIRVRAGARKREVQLLIQTNGTTLDDSAVEFLKRHEVSVGISVDGPATAHDAARPFRGGRGTHGQVMGALTRLKRAGVPHWAVATIGRHNLAEPEALVDYLLSLDLPDYVLKPVLPFGDARDTWQQVGISPDEYASFLARAVRRALAHSVDRLDLTTRQFFWRALGGVRGWSKSCTSRQCGCGENRLVFEADGRWTPCPRFGEYATQPGSPPPDGVAAPVLALPAWARALPQACRACPWQTHCGGGCALSGAEDPHCASYMANFDVIFEDIIPTLIEASQPAPPSLGPLEMVRVAWPAGPVGNHSILG